MRLLCIGFVLKMDNRYDNHRESILRGNAASDEEEVGHEGFVVVITSSGVFSGAWRHQLVVILLYYLLHWYC
jgi:hypothetical protein